MTLSISPTQDQIFVALRKFLINILPANVPVVQGQTNRVPEPQEDDYVIMILLRRRRIETNVDTFTDKAFIGFIVDDQMTITEVLKGTLVAGDQVTGEGVEDNTTVVSGPGGVGVYTVTPAGQTVLSTILQAGGGFYRQNTEITIQLEVHGPNSADNAQKISTMMRDDYAVEFFRTYPNIYPLYADDPRQMPFSNDQQQVEDRWVIEAGLQANQTVQAPQQFADTITVGLINVDAEYPPS